MSLEDALPGEPEAGDDDYTFPPPFTVNGLLFPGDVELDEGSYDYGGAGEIPPPVHLGVTTAQEFQEALQVGALHITIMEHLDMTESPVEADLLGLEGLNTAVGRVLNTTRSITVRIALLPWRPHRPVAISLTGARCGYRHGCSASGCQW